MPVNITIRNIPDKTRDELAARAAKSGRSLQEYLSLHLNELAARPSVSSAIADIRSRARTYPPVTAASVLDDLDADRK